MKMRRAARTSRENDGKAQRRHGGADVKPRKRARRGIS